MNFKLIKPFLLDLSSFRFICGDRKFEIDSISTPSFSTERSLSFWRNRQPIDARGYVLVYKGTPVSGGESIISENPKLDFVEIYKKIIEKTGFVTNYVHSIHESAQISSFSSIETGVKIGANTVIECFVKIAAGTVIGDSCIVKAGSSIGHNGFGFVRNRMNIPLEFPQLGRVHIGNNVQIGCNNTIARGALRDTIIEDNVKLDDHCHVAHNCYVGRNTIICPFVDLLGSVHIGKNSYIAPNAVILDGIKIGKDVMVGAKSYVNKNLPDSVVVFGTPAKIKKDDKG